MKLRNLLITLAIAAGVAIPSAASAQSYSFQVTRELVDVYWNDDGTSAIEYSFDFVNDAGAPRIEYVDVGIPNDQYDLGSVWATIDGVAVTDIEPSDYVSPGVAIGLGSRSIPAGSSGTVRVFIGRVSRVVYPDDDDKDYASAEFSPTWFGSEYAHGATHLRVTFHLPPGVEPEEPKYHLPKNWPGESEPQASHDADGRIIYIWESSSANAHTQYTFGASFPARVIPADSIVRPTIFDYLAEVLEPLCPCIFICGFFIFFIGIGAFGVWSENKRKKQYLSPKISIEGHGIKRGLTAVEAAILMEQPLDKVMTMILFGVTKKDAAKVVTKTPLKLEVTSPQPENLHAYEIDFLKAFEKDQRASQRSGLQTMTVNLIKSLEEKMKGFSRKETVEYYKSITEKAWQLVTAAGTPEVKAQAVDENLEWTMLDRNFNDRSRETWRAGPVFVPVWWGRYDPGFGRAAPAPTVSPRAGSPSTISLPQLPGADFAASVVNGVQNFSTNIIGDLTGFTGTVTNKTNPPPKPSSSSGRYGGGSGGRSCACACACAGCACACAGGGR